jgi:uncharacterized membrane protein YbaN (DUF454 family)
MIRKLLLVTLGVFLAIAGVAGLVLPIIPGVLLLAAAAGCLSLASSRFHRALNARLRHNRRYQAAARRWRAGDGLPVWRRLQLAFWLSVQSLLPSTRR